MTLTEVADHLIAGASDLTLVGKLEVNGQVALKVKDKDDVKYTVYVTAEIPNVVPSST